MSTLDIDLALPIALLAAALVGVILVRVVAARGERAAKERTRRLLQAVVRDGEPREDGMSDADRASVE